MTASTTDNSVLQRTEEMVVKEGQNLYRKCIVWIYQIHRWKLKNTFVQTR